MKCIQLIFLLLCLGGVSSAFAQKHNLIIYKDAVTGRDTVISRVSFADEKSFKKQYAISTIDKDGDITHTYKAKDIVGYKEEKTLYVSQRILIDNEVQHVLLPRVYWKNDISIYLFLSDKGREEYYVQISEDSLLLPLKGSPETNGVNPLAAYLEQFPMAQEEAVKRYIRNMKPTPDSFYSRYRVCYTGNINYIPKVRWGVLAGAGIAGLSYSTYDFGQKFQGFVGLFADVPIVEGFSFHPELMYREYSATSHSLEENGNFNGNAIYNRREIVLPMQLRYTLISTKGRFIPYIQGGAELGMAFKKEIESQYMTIDPDGFFSWTESGPISQQKFAMAYTVGIGMEWKMNFAHSLFFDLRYIREAKEIHQTGYYAVLSFNL